MSTTRLITSDDADTLSALLAENREFLAPYDPARDEDYYKPAGQQAVIRADLEQFEQGTKLPHVILDDTGGIVGRITLNGIVRGPLQSANLGYWVAAGANGRGLATRAVREIVRVAFEELELHRLEAGTLLHNVRSQRVLKRNGFVPFGVAPALLKIAGEWQDHILFQLLNEE